MKSNHTGTPLISSGWVPVANYRSLPEYVYSHEPAWDGRSGDTLITPCNAFYLVGIALTSPPLPVGPRLGERKTVVKKHQEKIWIAGILVALVCLSFLAYLWVAAGSFRVCTPQQSQDNLEKTVNALDSIIDLGLKLSTTLVGLGAALLLGWRTELKLTFSVKIILLLSTFFLIQSALYAVWWRFGVAQLWLNDCLELVAESRLGRRWEAHFYFFLAGLLSLGLLVIGTLFSEQATGDDK
jgi:hypothetical protein